MLLVVAFALTWHAIGPQRGVVAPNSPTQARAYAGTMMNAAVAPLVWSEAPGATGTFDADGTSMDNTYTWDGSAFGASDPLTVNYIAAGPSDAQPFLLVHGFGASGFHWRKNVNALATAGYRVYAIDLIGFGLSSKPIVEYDASLWREQCAAFLRDVAGCGASSNRRAIVAGNSIGGYTALDLGSQYPDLIAGVASLNGAGSYSPTPEEAAAAAELQAIQSQRPDWRVALDDALGELGTTIARGVAYAGLFVTKQPLRIRQVLRLVYPVTPEAADDELVASIRYPADDLDGLAPPNGIPEVFYRIVSRNARGGTVPVDTLVSKLEVPLLLLWGEKDPWIVSPLGDKLQRCAEGLGKDVRRVSVDAGHCPQDEAPEAVNAGLLEFAREIHASK